MHYIGGALVFCHVIAVALFVEILVCSVCLELSPDHTVLTRFVYADNDNRYREQNNGDLSRACA